jgi:beta-barrel assembly-enhancing protease
MKDTLIYYDGKSSTPQQILGWIDTDARQVVLEKDGKTIRWNVAELKYPEFKGADMATIHFGNFPAQSVEFLEKSEFGRTLSNILPKRTEGFWAFANEIVNSGFKGAALSFFLVVSAMLGLYFYVLPMAAESLAEQIPIEYEKKLGDKIFESMVDSNSIDLEKTKLLQDFAKKVKFKESGYTYQFFVINEDQINAFALPGGKIVVYQALLDKLKSPEELVALLGHETYHVRSKHSIKGLSRELSGSLVFAVIVGDAGALGSLALNNAKKISGLQYSRNMETDADGGGLELLKDNTLDQKGMLDLLKTLEEEEKKMGLDIPQFLSTHPLSENRIKAVKGRLDKEYIAKKRADLNISWEDLKK